jgi:hypothetical protein
MERAKQERFCINLWAGIVENTLVNSNTQQKL